MGSSVARLVAWCDGGAHAVRSAANPTARTRAGFINPSTRRDTTVFISRLLAGNWVGDADRAKGRFRTFLLTALNRFLANEWDRQHAQKRGGFTPVVCMDQELAESRFASELGHTAQPDVLFERQWATTLLERTMARLQEEYVTTGRAKLFEDLRSCLAKDESASPYAEIACADAGTTPSELDQVWRENLGP